MEKLKSSSFTKFCSQTIQNPGASSDPIVTSQESSRKQGITSELSSKKQAAATIDHRIASEASLKYTGTVPVSLPLSSEPDFPAQCYHSAANDQIEPMSLQLDYLTGQSQKIQSSQFQSDTVRREFSLHWQERAEAEESSQSAKTPSQMTSHSIQQPRENAAVDLAPNKSSPATQLKGRISSSGDTVTPDRDSKDAKRAVDMLDCAVAVGAPSSAAHSILPFDGLSKIRAEANGEANIAVGSNQPHTPASAKQLCEAGPAAGNMIDDEINTRTTEEPAEEIAEEIAEQPADFLPATLPGSPDMFDFSPPPLRS